MASTYVNALRLEEMATGEQSGTWGTKTNTNLELIGQALSWGTRAIADASTDNITIADGASDADRSMYLKLTGGGQTCTITLLPNTSSKMWIMENATSYALTFTQGSGANAIVAAGQTKMIFADGLGSGAVVYELGAFTLNGDLTSAGTINPLGDTASGDAAAVGYTSAEGIIITGQGSTNDVTIKNDADADVLEIPTGTTNVTVVGDITAGATLNAAGDTAASDNAAIGYTSAEGLILTGQGSTNDVTIKNDADADVLVIPTGATNVDIVGVATAATFEPDGDTSASDNAAIGYTSAEGLILTGQGSTNDVTIKNDADADVIKIPTGTTNVTIVGNLTTATGGIATASIADNAITLAKMAGGTDGNIISYDASGDPVAIATGNDGQVLTSAGAGAPPAFEDAAGGGALVAMKTAALRTVVTGTTRIVNDDTIPQNDEGTEILTLAITPASSSSVLVITANVIFEINDNQNDSGSIFICQDSTANSLAATIEQQYADKARVTTLMHYMAAGTTSETTFKLRVGNSQTGNWTVNGVSGGTQKMGGVASTTLSIMEYTP